MVIDNQTHQANVLFLHTKIVCGGETIDDYEMLVSWCFDCGMTVGMYYFARAQGSLKSKTDNGFFPFVQHSGRV